MSTYFDRARSKVVGGVTEVVLMTPVLQGMIPGERRTYEERLREVLDSIQGRAEKGISTPVNHIATIHFARWLIIRPEHFLGESRIVADRNGKAPFELDDYVEIGLGGQGPLPMNANPARDDNYKSWLMTLILFDDDVKVYGREIANFIQVEVDKIFENCEHYPYAKDFPAWWAWFRRYQMNTGVFYNAYPGLTVARIRELQRFRDKFDAFVSKVRPHNGEPVEPTDALLDEFIRENQMIASGFPNEGGIYDED